MKGVLGHGLLAQIGLVLVYRTYTRPAEMEDVPDSSRTAIAACEPSGLREIRMETPTHTIVAKPEGEGAHEAFWITTRRKPEAVADGKASQTPDGDTNKPRHFLSNDAFADYMKKLTPLMAARSLGQLPKDKLAQFGFDNVGTRLAVQCGDKTLQLEVGERTYGTGQRYVRDQTSKATYLIDDELVSNLQSAQFKFIQTDLHTFTHADIDEIVVEAKGAQKRLLQRERKVPERATWVDASAQTTRNELYGNWLSRLERLRVREFLEQGGSPGSDFPATAAQVAPVVTPVVTAQYFADGAPKGKLELVRVDAGKLTRYYARSETTGVWVSVFDSSAKDVEQDMGLLVGVDEPKPAHGAGSAHP